MARTAFRIGLIFVSVSAAGLCALMTAAGIEVLDLPEQRVGLRLEFPDSSTAESDMRAAHACLPRLLTATGARTVRVEHAGDRTLEATFHPLVPWSEEHGLRADDGEAERLLPEDLRTLLTKPTDVRFLQVLLTDEGLAPTYLEGRARTAALLDGHPEQRMDSLRAALHVADTGEPAIAWCPLEAQPSELIPVLCEGKDRRVTCGDLAGAWHTGPRDTQVEVWFDEDRSTELTEYLDHLVGRRLAVVVEGAVACTTRVERREGSRLRLAGDGRDLTSAESAEIVKRVAQPSLPSAPRIQSSWITPTHSTRTGGFMISMAIAAALVAVGALAFFVRDVRRGPEPVRKSDWSSRS